MKYSKEWLKESEIKRILELSDLSEKHETWILLLYYPALRVSEAINVRVQDINIEQKCIDVWGGKGKDLTELQKAPCDISVLRQIKRYCQHEDLRPSDYIMRSQKRGQVSRQQVYRTVKQLCLKADIDKQISTHTFRRSRAEHLLDRGLKLTYVSKYLRHKSVTTTMKYLDVSVEDIHRELEKLDKGDLD